MVHPLGQITLGRPGDALQLNGLRLLESRYEPARILRPHAHRSGNVSLILAGDFEEHVGGERVVPRPTSFVLKPGGTVHSNRYGDRAVRAFVIEIDPLRQGEIELGRRDPGGWFAGGRGAACLLEIYRAFREGRESTGELEARTLETLREVVRTSRDSRPSRALGTRATNTLARAERALRSSLDAPPDTTTLASRVGVHPVYLARLFRAAHGCGTAAFRRRLQVHEAARRLAETDCPLAELADATGFADQSHLSRAFKAELGLPPGAYRRLVRERRAPGLSA